MSAQAHPAPYDSQRAAELSELLGHVNACWDNERRSLSRQLHDSMGSSLTALTMHLGLLTQKLPPDPALLERATQMKNLLHTIIDTNRQMQHRLWNDKLEFLGVRVALGDCALCMGADGKPVPPRAQAAHQQADYLAQTFLRQAQGRAPQSAPYVYKDYGSLVSFGQTSSVGSLMGSLKGLNWFVDGFVARLMYTSLHLMHHQAVLGTVRTGVLALARFLIKRTTPLVKLH